MKSIYQLDTVKKSEKDTPTPVFVVLETPDKIRVSQQSGEGELRSAEYVHKLMANALHMQILNGNSPKPLMQYEFTGDMVKVDEDNAALKVSEQVIKL